MAAVLLVAALAACGGGGGGGDGGGGSAGAGPSGPATLGGQVSYASVPNPNGPLDYAASVDKPVRGAPVEVLDALSDAVLASTQTDDAGHYSVALTGGRAVTVRVRAQTGGASPGARWDVSVRDNTQGGAVYAIESPAFNLMAGSATRDLHAASGWGAGHYTGQRTAAPFAILDTLRASVDKVLSVAPDTVFPALRVFWSVNNVPAYGDASVGQIGTTSFTRDQSGPVIYVLGKEDLDTDEYDASVITHEWGHYYQDAFSRDDSPGGAHSMADSLDARLAFSEGWGNAWSGIALGRANYTDALGAAQASPGSTNLDLRKGPPDRSGWYREASIHAILWQLNARAGFKPIHDVMTGSLAGGAALTDIHAFSAGLFARVPAGAASLSELLTGQAISAAVGDPFGQSETNNGGLTPALPLYHPAAIGTSTPACVSNVFGSYNKLGSFVYLRVEVPTARSYVIRIDGPAAADPDVSVYSGRLVARSEGYGASETATVSLPAGTAVLAINDANNTSSWTCFSVSIN